MINPTSIYVPYVVSEVQTTEPILVTPVGMLKKHTGFILTKDDLVSLIKDAFDKGVDYTKSALNEESFGEFDELYQDKTSKDVVHDFINELIYTNG